MQGPGKGSQDLNP